MDWSKCIVCQAETGKKLSCPAKSKRKDTGAGYETFIANIRLFEEAGCEDLPEWIKSEVKDAETLAINEGKWHSTCYSRFSRTKADRLAERKRKRESDAFDKTFTRVNSSNSNDPRGVTESTASTPRMFRGNMCFLCHEKGGRLHLVQTLELDRRLRDCVQDLQDQQLIAELNTASDLVAREAKYHAKCLTAVYNRHRDSEKARASNTSMSSASLALAELIAFMEESNVEDRSTVFRLADLSKLYEARVNQLRGQFPLQARAHSTHLKKRLLQNVPGLVAFNQGREVYLYYDEEVALTLKRQYNEEEDTESITMARLANSIRNDMFATSVSFTGQFDHETQIQSVPQRLLVLINMIINGPNIKDQAEPPNITQPVLTVAQLLMGNAYKQRRKPKEPPTQIYVKNRQMPLSIYVGMKVHSLTRKRQLVDSLHELGLSESYDSIMDIKTSLGNNIINHYSNEGVVCPPQLRTGEFVVGAADNIDHNPSSTTSTGSFHGTGISLFQNCAVTLPNPREQRLWETFQIEKQVKEIRALPSSFTEVKPLLAPTNMTALAGLSEDTQRNPMLLTSVVREEKSG
ncbi:hypothetical protein RRG08_010121 [Elysia crispata]|uniref:Uncharacterized protein n=1 Tax=Elysia crispata TaxID=231223 RepID=A0AAE0Z2Z1_9GAST|nr:hypothetical protein RRG08_010121 [Elysia crispata]